MRLVAVIVIALTLSTVADAQQREVQHQATTQPVDARFEIIQSTIALRWTFKLDRYLGTVHQLVDTKEGKGVWELMPIEEPTASTGDRPRYQIVLSGIAAKSMFLLDSANGQAWLLVTMKRSTQDGTPYDSIEWRRMSR